jgi:hypothetical protein
MCGWGGGWVWGGLLLLLLLLLLVSQMYLAPCLGPQLPCSAPHRTYNLSSSSALLASLWRANDWKPTDTWSALGSYATSLVSSGLDMDAIEPAFGNGFRWVRAAASFRT